jgi:hypothetical protein
MTIAAHGAQHQAAPYLAHWPRRAAVWPIPVGDMALSGSAHTDRRNHRPGPRIRPGGGRNEAKRGFSALQWDIEGTTKNLKENAHSARLGARLGASFGTSSLAHCNGKCPPKTGGYGSTDAPSTSSTSMDAFPSAPCPGLLGTRPRGSHWVAAFSCAGCVRC